MKQLRGLYAQTFFTFRTFLVNIFYTKVKQLLILGHYTLYVGDYINISDEY